MKKTFLFIIFVLISSVCFGDIYTLKNADIRTDIELSSKNIYISRFEDLKNHTEFIASSRKDFPLWFFVIKKDRDFGGKEITLYPGDAQNVTVKENTGKKFSVIWENVKKDFMQNGFDVTCIIKLENNNSYWDIDISPNSEYGIWSVTYPNIENINAQKGDNLMIPYRGGKFYRDFESEKGLELPHIMLNEENPYSKDLGYYLPQFMQYSSFTKGNSTLYMCPEDLKSNIKTVNYHLNRPHQLDYIVRMFPANMAIAGKGYTQPYSFNISAVKGDWYDAAKYYRAWGIKKGYGIFGKGKIEDRTDLPQWIKENVAWTTWQYFFEETVDNLIRYKNYLGVNMGLHLYHISEYAFDTHYPNWLPYKPNVKTHLKRLKEAGYRIMPYTNPTITDVNQSPAYKKYGDDMLSVDENGNFYPSPYNENGAKNMWSCPKSVYKEAYISEVLNIMKETDFDGLYMDQVGCIGARTCFNEKHNHIVGGGNYFTEGYNDIIEELREKLTEMKGEPVFFTTESEADAYNFDGWLRIEDGGSNVIDDTQVNSVVYSGYGVSFGENFKTDEFKLDNSLPAILKNVSSFVRGIQPGWIIGSGTEFEDYPAFAEHFRKLVNARASAVEFFNLGEMTREVKITSPVPTRPIKWYHFDVLKENDFPVIRTVSYNYKGKTAVAFCSLSDTPVKVDWEANAKDLNLKNRNSYKITQIYPEKKIINEDKTIKSSFVIQPFDTVVFIIE